MASLDTAPRIYNIHPLLAGPISTWADHLPRIRAMGFDWIYVNSFFAPGASGSIYAVADPWELHPKVRGTADLPAAKLVARFAESAARAGLRVMTDLIVPHAARDARLAAEHPDWFHRGPHGDLQAPILANPNDPSRPRYMPDLAELDLARAEHHAAQLDYFDELARHWLSAGISGFRCSAAYKVPPPFWGELIDRLRARQPEAVFLAAALGCPFERTRRLAGCGFDLIFDSSKWWDFRGPWFLDQYEELRRIAPTVAFPEDHNTPRLAVEAGVSDPELIARLYRARYMATLGLGCGCMMPMGFEFGCREPLDPVATSARGLGARNAGATRRPPRLHRGRASLEGRHAGHQPAWPAASGDRTERANRGRDPLRPWLARLRGQCLDPADQPRPGPQRRAGLGQPPDLGGRTVHGLPGQHASGAAAAL